MKRKDNSNKALFIQRVLAFAFDIFIVSIVVSFVCMPFLDYDSINNLNENADQILVDYSEGSIDTDTYIDSASSILYRLAKKQGIMSLATIFLNLLYFVVYQFHNKGQTLGKKLLGIKVVSNNSKDLIMNNYIYRSFIINSVVADMLVFAFVIFASEAVWFNGAGIIGVINYTLLFICGLMVILSKDGRGLHDLVGNTKVIQCRK